MFFALVGVCGLLSHCLSSDDVEPPTPCLAGGSCECFPASPEACFVFTIIVVVVFAIPGIIYGFIGATKAFQKIVQSHYHILTKKELTKARTSLIYLHSQFFSSNEIFLIFRHFWWTGVHRGRPSWRLLDATQDGPRARAAPEDVAAHVAAASTSLALRISYRCILRKGRTLACSSMYSPGRYTIYDP